MRVLSGKHVIRLLIATALAGATIAVVNSSPAAAAGVPCQKTFTNDVDVPIPDNAPSVFSDINVPEDGYVVSDVDVTVNVHHTFDSDLSMFMYSLTDALELRSVTSLFVHTGGGADNVLGTVFDDEATLPITWGDAPFTGRFKPDRPLASADGFAGGTYRLYVGDNATNDTGTLNSWSITLRYKSCDFDADGVEDHGDKCLGISAHTSTGCPLTTRSLTAKYKKGKFRGAMSSPVAGCKSHRSVTVWKARSGADKKIGTATTRSDGTYRLTRARHVGKYYATSPRVAVTDVAECPASKSATFRIR